MTTSAELSGIGIVSGVVLALFGVPLQPIMWGFIGGVIGSAFAPPVKWWALAVASYIASSLLSALAGQVLADRYFLSNTTSADLIAACIAVFFHPILTTAAQHVPNVVNWGFRIFKGPQP